MPKVALKPNLIERLEQVAAEEDTSAEELLDLAVTEFLEKVAVHKLQDETRAFEASHPQLVQQYFGEYVAIHNGVVVDHDLDVRQLHLRIRNHFGQQRILLRQVTETAELPAIFLRSPKVANASL